MKTLLFVGQKKDDLISRCAYLVLSVIIALPVNTLNAIAINIVAERLEDIVDCTTRSGKSVFVDSVTNFFR
jgi:hypothetical protein